LLTGAFCAVAAVLAAAAGADTALAFGGTLGGAALPGAALGAAALGAGFFGGGALAFAFAAAAFVAVFDAITVLCARLLGRRIAKKGSASATRTNQGRKSGQGSLSPD
jgi:hypothetical protein